MKITKKRRTKAGDEVRQHGPDVKEEMTWLLIQHNLLPDKVRGKFHHDLTQIAKKYMPHYRKGLKMWFEKGKVGKEYLIMGRMKTNLLEAQEERMGEMLRNITKCYWMLDRYKDKILNMVLGHYYCQDCRKLYPHKKCKSYIEMEGGYPGDFVKECPKGHDY